MGGQFTRPCCHIDQLPRSKVTISAASPNGLRSRIQRQFKYAENYEEVSVTRDRIDASLEDQKEGDPIRVYDVRGKHTQLLYVCRHVKKDDIVWADELDTVKHHLSTVCGLEHPHVCKAVEVFDMPKEYLIISEYAHGPPLLDHLKPKDGSTTSREIERLAPELVRQMLSALSFCHERGIVHGRLEPSVLLMAAADGGGRRFKEKNKATGQESERKGCPQVKIRDMGLGFLIRPCLSQDPRAFAVKQEDPAAEDLEKPAMIEDTKEKTKVAQEGEEGEEEEQLSDPEEEVDPDEFEFNEKRWTMALTCAAPETLEAACLHGDPVWAPEAQNIRSSIPTHQDILDEDDMVKLQKGAAPKLAYPADIWAVGVIAYRLLTGHLPFNKHHKSDGHKSVDTGDELLEAISNEHLSFHHDKVFKDHEARDAVDKMMKLNAGLRPTASEMLKHPWLKLPTEEVSSSTMRGLYMNAMINLQECQFKKLVNRIIAELLPASHAHIEEAHEAFKSLDKDLDGMLNVKEFKTGLKHFSQAKAIFEENYWDEDMLFDAADRSGSGSLNPQEFYAATLPVKISRSEKWLWYAFKAFDRDDNGQVTVQEITDALRLMDGSLCSEEQMKELTTVIRAEVDALHITADEVQAAEYKPKSRETIKEEYDEMNKEIEIVTEANKEGELGDKKFVSAEVPQQRHMALRHLDNSWLYARQCAPPYRSLNFGEFIYLLGGNAKDRHLPLLAKRFGKKEFCRFSELFLSMDFYPERREAADPKLDWPPKVGAAASSVKSIYWRRDGLTTVRKPGQGRKDDNKDDNSPK